MGRRERIISVLQRSFAPTLLEVKDDSAQHRGHAGARPEGETHFDVIIVSSLFEGKRAVQRHQLVYAPLREEFQNGLHALTIHASTPQEFSQKNR